MNHPIILFDGVCNLCNASVQWVLRRDRRAVFRFAALQSEPGQQLLRQFGLDSGRFETVVLVAEGRVFVRSEAALEIARRLGGGWRLAGLLRVFPLFLRDAVYGWVARNRYRWFGKQEICWLPTPALRERFL